MGLIIRFGWCIIIGGGIPGIPCINPGPMFRFVGGGIATPPGFGGGPPWANGFEAILPALNAAVVASIKC